jgi:hypothetical protein
MERRAQLPRKRCAPAALAILTVMAAGCGGRDGAGREPVYPIDPVFLSTHPRIYLERNRARLEAALGAARPAAVRFREVVDRWMGGADVYAFQTWYAALLGQLTVDGSYCARAVDALDAEVAAEERRIAAGEAPEVAFDSYLYVGDRVGDVMLTYDWCFDAVAPERRARWLAYAEQAVWNVWHHELASWGGVARPWSGWSVDNPSNNYYYSFLRATMLLGLAAHGEGAGGSDWPSFFRDTKVLSQLAPTFERDLSGGGSREGTGYGVSMHRLWELYDFWEGSTGEDLAGRSGHALASMRAFMHQIVPTLDRVAPTGDHARESTGALFDYHRNYLLELAYLFPDEALSRRARYLLGESSVPAMTAQFMYVYDFLYDTDSLAEPLDGMGRAYHAPGIGELYARSSWERSATWVNLVAGPYTESHAHQDQGSLLLYKEGWLAYDPNVESHSGLIQATDAHNLVRIVRGGESIPQREGTSTMVALHRGDGWLHAAVDTRPVYADAGVQKVEREVVYLEPDCVVVFDRVTSAAGTSQVWQLSSPAQPSMAGAVATFPGTHALSVRTMLPEAAARSVHRWADDDEFQGGYRYEVSVAGGANHFLHVLWIDGAVTVVTPSDGAGTRGVDIALPDGRVATVRFGTDGVDGALAIAGGAGGAVSVALGAGVDPLPE